MTTPIQAQIEAAQIADRLRKIAGTLLASTSEDWVVLRAADMLTAAAEADDKSEGKIAELEAREEYALNHLDSQIEENEKLRAKIAATIIGDLDKLIGELSTNGKKAREIAALTTAAEVEEQAYKTHSVDFLEGVAEGTAATIERCAQVAESYIGYISAPSPETLAAAIRALKDKP